jgi:deoxyribodipyrimidine photo-lyase
MIMTSLFWFRQDLRLSDNPGLTEAARSGAVIPVYILEDMDAGPDKMGAASRVFLHHALDSLNKSLNGKLVLMHGHAESCLQSLISSTGANSLFWNRCYEPWRIARDTKLKAAFTEDGISVHSYQASLLWEPMQIHKADGTPYKVFTPFYRRGCLAAEKPRTPLPAPQLELVDATEQSLGLDDLALLPTRAWGASIIKGWDASETGAQDAVHAFCSEGIDEYQEGRNFPAKRSVSRLSPHLHFGTISPHQAWHEAGSNRPEDDKNLDIFRSELGWREFSHSLLYFNSSLKHENLNKKFDSFPWKSDDARLLAWQTGQTGYPIVDAGMRELYQTGYMHNRVRMIVGSFLVKNLLLDWRHGEAWFWDCLFDADHANNSASWQWIAGCGADAAPYFRVFNPVTQGEKFDKHGDYTKRFVPELTNLPDKYLYAPWTAPKDILEAAGISLGSTYPHPIVDVKSSRVAALDAFATLPKAS